MWVMERCEVFPRQVLKGKECGKWLVVWLVAMLVLGSAHAGTITFRGAVVLPTCADPGLPEQRHPDPAWKACARVRTSAAKHAVNTNEVLYRTSVRTLDRAEAMQLKSVTWRARQAHIPADFSLQVETRTYQ